MKYIRKVLACLRKADERYALIDDNDRIVLGISGGKDSLCLLKAMSIYGKFSSKNFKIYPVCLDLGFPDFNSTELEKYCSSSSFWKSSYRTGIFLPCKYLITFTNEAL